MLITKVVKRAARLVPEARQVTRFWRKDPLLNSESQRKKATDIERMLTLFDAKQPPIVVDNVDYTFNRPWLVADSFAATLARLSYVEWMVQYNVEQIRAIFPHMEDYHQQFLRIWGPQEVAHGLILDKAAGILGLPQLDMSPVTINPSLSFVGILLERLPSIRDAVFLAYLTTGGVTESAATSVYRLWIDQLVKMGEPHFANTGIKWISLQEPTHFAYYRLSAELLRGRMAFWQILMARVLKRFGNPLPSADKKHQEEFGQATLELTGSDDAVYMELALKFHRAYLMLLGFKNRGADIPSPVLDALKDCRDLSLRRQTEHEALIPQLAHPDTWYLDAS